MSTALTASEAAEKFREFIVLAFAGQLNAVWYAWQREATAERPDLPYATVKWLRSRALSSAPYTRVGDEVDPDDPGGLTHEKITQVVREGVVQLVIYGEGGDDLLESLPTMKAQHVETKALHDARIAIRALTDPISDAVLRETHYEPFHVQEWAVFYTTEQTDRTGTIETLAGSSTLLPPKE